jgi:F-box-like
MDRLPNEILIAIFKHLRQVDLLNVTQVCTLFRDLVNKFELIEHLYISAWKKNCKVPFRNYRKVTMTEYSPMTYLSVLEAKGDHITSMTLLKCELTLVDLVNILRATPRVKTLTFDDVATKDCHLNTALELPNLDITDFAFKDSSNEIFCALMKSSMQSITVEMRFVRIEQLNDFVRVLEQQERLTSLSISGLYQTYNLNLPRGKPNYRLKSFSIEHCELNWELLENYLSNHTDSLETLIVKIVNWDASNIINRCAVLKTLQFVAVGPLLSLNVLPHVEELMDLPALQEMNLFPGVKKLKVSFLLEGTTETISRTMRNLEELELMGCGVAELEVPTVKKMKLMHIEPAITGEFFVVHNKIEDLTLKNIFSVDDSLLEAVTRNLANLRVLRILGDNRLSARAFRIIRENCHELKVFEMDIWDRRYQKREKICLYQMNGLRISRETGSSLREDFF